MKPHKIYAENIDPKALDQFYSALKQDFAVQGALMPDAHVGYSLPIGGVVATKNVVVPAWIGYDIGCGMLAFRTGLTKDQVSLRAQHVHAALLENIPVGFSHHAKPQSWSTKNWFPRTGTADKIFAEKNALHQIGTLGGGNHFIEIGYDEQDQVWCVIHSGSRGFGHALATHYMKLAGGGKARDGHYGLELGTPEGDDYWTDLQFAQQFALENRIAIMYRVCSVLDGLFPGYAFSSRSVPINRNHNHAELRVDLIIHRKGATHAEEGMLGVIPGNMRDGSFIVLGKGNPESLWSSSHGAGRVLGRREAKETLDVQKFSETMQGIVAQVGEGTLDESPMAYKDIFQVMQDQQELVEVLYHVKPIINVKG